VKEIFVRAAVEADRQNVAEWVTKNAAENQIDTDIFAYPQTKIYAATNGKPICYLPVQMVVMMESLAPNPEATDSERAEAIRQLLKGVVLQAHGAGIREVYFVGTDKRVNRIATRHGFEKIKFPVYRMKI
jgi:N-acetylglutamate synthase-like GNAT family acetyltransferase